METLWQDVRYAFRILGKSPGFLFVAVVTLALGIGVNTAIFSVVNGVLLKPLPYAAPDRLVRIYESNPPAGFPFFSVSVPNFYDWRDQNQVFEHIAAYNTTSQNYTEGELPERLLGAAVTASLFPMLGVQPALGRALLPEEERFDKSGVIVLSHGLWQRRFGGNPNVLGKSLLLNERSYLVVGVMPESFYFPSPNIEFWTPLAFPSPAPSRGAHFLRVIARLKPGVSLPQAETEMKTIAGRLEQQYPATNQDSTVRMETLYDNVVGHIRTSLLVLWGAVGFVVLIACANVANLLLARATSREKEIAVRAAVGASRWRILRQLLTESLLLAVAGGGLGLLLAKWGIPPLLALGENTVPRAESVGIDASVLWFTLALALLTGILFGLAPAWRTLGTDLNEVLREGSRRTTASGNHWLRGLLVVSEVALALILVIGASLLIGSFARLQQVNPGFQAQNLLTFRVSLPRTPDAEERITNFYRDLLARLEALPGVESAAVTHVLPMAGNYFLSFTIGGKPTPEPGKEPASTYRTATPHFFSAMGIPLLRGRVFTEQDARGAPLVAVVSEAWARRYFPNEEALGQRIDISNGTEGFSEIVGVVGNVKSVGLDAEDDTIMYAPFAQDVFRSFSVVVRTKGDPLGLANPVRREVRALDASLPVFGLRPMEEIVANSVAQPRFATLLLAVFATVALALAAVGIYGVISYSVSQRAHEIGIRTALGAQRADIFRLVLSQGLGLTLAGIALGLVGAFGLTRFLASLLFGVTPTDPATFAGIAVLLVLVAVAACYLPARRATRVNPIVALRYE